MMDDSLGQEGVDGPDDSGIAGDGPVGEPDFEFLSSDFLCVNCDSIRDLEVNLEMRGIVRVDGDYRELWVCPMCGVGETALLGYNRIVAQLYADSEYKPIPNPDDVGDIPF